MPVDRGKYFNQKLVTLPDPPPPKKYFLLLWNYQLIVFFSVFLGKKGGGGFNAPLDIPTTFRGRGNVKNIFPCLAGVEDADGDVCADGDVDGDAGPLVAGNHAVPVRI